MFRYTQSKSRVQMLQSSQTKKRTKNQKKRTEKLNKSKSTVSEKSWSNASLKEKIFCFILCCCYFKDGESD